MIEVALGLLLVATTLGAFFNDRLRVARLEDERNVARWMSIHANALRAYLEEHAHDLVQDNGNAVLDVRDKLVEGSYLAPAWQARRGDGRKIATLVRIACIDEACEKKQPIGMVALTGPAFASHTAHGIATKIETGGGVIEADGRIVGLGQVWVGSTSDWLGFLEPNQPAAAVLALPKRMWPTRAPVITDVHHVPSSAAIPGDSDADLWQPLYSTDSLRVTWRMKNVERVRADVYRIDGGGSTKLIETETLNRATEYRVQPVADMFGNSVMVRLTPITDGGNEARSVTTRVVSVSEYPRSPVTGLTLGYSTWTTGEPRRPIDAPCNEVGNSVDDPTHMFFAITQIDVHAPNWSEIPEGAAYVTAVPFDLHFKVASDLNEGTSTQAHGTPNSGSIRLTLTHPNAHWPVATLSELLSEGRVHPIVHDCRRLDNFKVDLDAVAVHAGHQYVATLKKGGFVKSSFTSAARYTEDNYGQRGSADFSQ